jgi:hypothetical protein
VQRQLAGRTQRHAFEALDVRERPRRGHDVRGDAESCADGLLEPQFLPLRRVDAHLDQTGVARVAQQARDR